MLGDKETKAYYGVLETGLVTQEVLDLVLSLMGDTVNTCNQIIEYYTGCKTLEDYMEELNNA